MSRHARRIISISVAFAAVAVAACDTPTQPQPNAARVTRISKIDGDTTLCTHGFTVIQGRYECNPN